jgi:DNA helicase HerA-like ATPase
MILLPTSTGETVDKLTILQLKLENITDPAKRHNVQTEYDLLMTAINEAIGKYDEATYRRFHQLWVDIYAVNAKLWQVEDEIRDRERNKDFGREFIELARSVYFINDERSRLKKDLNLLVKSGIVEEKSYSNYA